MIKMADEHFHTLAQLNPQNMFIELNEGYGIQKDLWRTLKGKYHL